MFGSSMSYTSKSNFLSTDEYDYSYITHYIYSDAHLFLSTEHSVFNIADIYSTGTIDSYVYKGVVWILHSLSISLERSLTKQTNV
jgi:hypothetical protein